MTRLAIIEPCFFGELLVQSAVSLQLPIVLLTMSGTRCDELRSRWPSADTQLVDTTNAAAMEVFFRSRPDVGAILSGTEHLIHVVGDVIERTGLRGPFDAATGRRARFKDEMRRALTEARIPQPGYHVYDSDLSVRRHFSAPTKETPGLGDKTTFVFKPSWLGGSWGIKKVATDRETDQALKELAEIYLPFPFAHPLEKRTFLMENLVSAEMEVSVEVYRRNGQTRFLGVTEKFRSSEPYFIEVGHVHPARRLPVSEQHLRATVENTLDSLGIRDGAAHCELLLDSHVCCVVECAARNGGDRIMDLVEAATGVNLPLCCVCGVMGMDEPTDQRHQKAAAIGFLTPPTDGKWAMDYRPFEKKDGATLTWKLPPPGTIVERHGVANVMHRVGHVIATAGDSEDACAAVDCACKAIGFRRIG